MYSVFFIIYIVFQLFVVRCEVPECSKLITSSEDGNRTEFIVLTLTHMPTKIVFENPVSSVESSLFNFWKVTGKEWTVNRTLESLKFDISNQNIVFYASPESSLETSKSSAKVTRLAYDGGLLCESRKAAFTHGPCGIQGELDLRPEKILLKRAAWATGRNYRISIPSYPNFIGYVVDIFFAKPVTNVQAWKEGVKVVKTNPIHWSLVKEWTENACVKLVEVDFMVTFEEMTDISALLFNGNPLIGEEKSQAFFKNKNYDNALTADCEQILTKNGNPWFGEEKARPLWFEAIVDTAPQIGVIVDFIFKDNIQELRLWELTAEKISGNYWRVHNAGLIIPRNGTLRFPMTLYYFQHYHVNLIGVKINGEVKCGFGRPTTLIISEDTPKEASLVNESNMGLESLYDHFFICLIMVCVSIFVSTILFGVILLFKLQEVVRKKNKHLCDYPAPTFNESNYGENNYASISEATDSTATYSHTSQM